MIPMPDGEKVEWEDIEQFDTFHIGETASTIVRVKDRREDEIDLEYTDASIKTLGRSEFMEKANMRM